MLERCKERVYIRLQIINYPLFNYTCFDSYLLNLLCCPVLSDLD